MPRGILPGMETIRSRRNPLLQRIRVLLERPRERQQAGVAVIEGEHLLLDWRAAGHAVERVLLAVSRAGELARWQGEGVVIVLVDDDCLASVSPAAGPAGLLALVPVPACQPVTRGSVLVLDAVQDPGNVGTLLRVAAACGLDQAWLGPGCADAWSWKVLRAGQGAHATLPVWQGGDLAQALGAYAGRVVALVPRGGTPLFKADLRGDIALLLGGEGAGLGEAALWRADVRITIPMPGRAESLNVAMAGAIALYERVRQLLASD